MLMRKQKIKIVEYAQSAVDSKMLVAYTTNGGRLELYPCDVPLERCRTKGRLFVTGSGLFFSLTKRRGLKQVFENFGLARRTPGRHCHNGVRGCDYPQMRDYGLVYCHILVCTVFHGPRPVVNGVVYQCDHKNGNIMDWSKDNLEWVTPHENAKRRAILRALRMNGQDPRKMAYAELDELFRKYRLVDGAKQIEYEMSHHCEC